jgi:asparagine synthase (glutamine-hydrolysing)
MCGIFATIGGPIPQKNILSHRGPDTFSETQIGDACFMFWRLAINDIEGGNQPIKYKEKWIIANAEIYNHVEHGGVPGQSDCEVILPLIETEGFIRACEMMSGDFAFVITDGKKLWAARDRIGVRPLFYSRHKNGVSFASEAKALTGHIDIFPPGHLYDPYLDNIICWAPNYWDHPRVDTDVDFITEHIRYLLYESVHKRVVGTTERPVGFFLSGGLDSSIVAYLGQKALGTKIKTFSIGLPDSPDLVAARKMAEFLDSDHTEVHFTIEEGLSVLKKVIWHLESFDTTTVRASVPMYLLSKYIKENTDIRVVLSGEGSDELFGGYLYFHGAPNDSEFLAETGRLVRDVHMFDVLRADRTTAAHGLELRVPFFDRDVIDYVMDGFSHELKRPANGFEKCILRAAFDGLIPNEICWRQKDGMSDAVGTSWVNALRKTGEDYKSIFGNVNTHLTPYKWLPRWSDVKDPSARLLQYSKA